MIEAKAVVRARGIFAPGIINLVAREVILIYSIMMLTLHVLC